MKKLNLMLCVLVFTIAAILNGQAFADCEACAGNDRTAYCTSGNHGMNCEASTTGCTFSGASCGEGGGCFLAGTMISTLSGPKAVELVGVGDQVLSYDEEGNHQWALVEGSIKVLKTEFFSINGKLSVTADHPFFVNGNWVNAEDLRIGDRLTGQDSAEIEIASIERVNKGVRVYNIDVISPDTFFANGILVHNKSFVGISQ